MENISRESALAGFYVVEFLMGCYFLLNFGLILSF